MGGFDGNGMGILEGGEAFVEVHLVPLEVFRDTSAFRLHDLLLAVKEVAGGDLVFQGKVDAVEAALMKAGEVERGLTKGLGGQGAGIGGGPAKDVLLLDERDTFAEVGRLRGAFFTG